MARIQATAKVHDVELKAISSGNIVTISCFERLWSKNRKYAQEKYTPPAIKDRDSNGVYYMWYQLRVFVPDTQIARYRDLSKGSFIDFMGELHEDVWLDKQTGEKRTRLYISSSDVKFIPTGERPASQESSQRHHGATAPTGKPEPDAFGDDIPFDDIPF
jgi:hypothetical protein